MCEARGLDRSAVGRPPGYASGPAPNRFDSELRTDRPRRARRGLITRLAPPRGGVPECRRRCFARVGAKYEMLHHKCAQPDEQEQTSTGAAEWATAEPQEEEYMQWVEWDRFDAEGM